MPILSTLTKSIVSQINARKSDAYLIDLSEEAENFDFDESFGSTNSKNRRLPFQYWPETISDTKATNYQQKEIPGASLPLYQWINGGERLITFTSVFTTDVDLIAAEPPPGLLFTGGGVITERLKAAGVERRNVDIRAAIAWLRSFVYPSYDKQWTLAPRKLRLVLPNSGIGLAGANTHTPDSVRCVMTQCDVSYEQFFPNGLPRIATVQLGFAEVAQFAGKIEFPSRTSDMDDAVAGKRTYANGYTFTPKEKLPPDDDGFF